MLLLRTFFCFYFLLCSNDADHTCVHTYNRYIEEKHFVSKDSSPREKIFNEAASYILNRTEKKIASSVDTALQKKNQWYESIIRMPRVLPERSIHDELMKSTNLYSNTGNRFVSRGNTSPLRRLLDQHRKSA